MKIIKILNYIVTFLAITCLYTIGLSISIYLLEENIVVFVYDWIKYPYYFSVGLLLWYPMNSIINKNK